MTYQYSVAVRNAKLDAVETAIGISPVLKFFSGAEPVNCAAADPSGLLATVNLPADWMADASGGQKTKLGTWTGTASATGLVASWRIYAGSACHIQGSQADMPIDNPNLVSSQTLTITGFTLTSGNP